MKQKRKNKITKQQEQLLAAIKHCERREPIPRPAVFISKKDYNRQAQNAKQENSAKKLIKKKEETKCQLLF